MGYDNGEEQTREKKAQRKHQKQSTTMENTKHKIYEVSKDTSL